MAKSAPMLVLCGPPSVGKSTIGRMCAQRLGVRFIDTDQVIAQQFGGSIAELVSQEGEAALRDRERALIERLPSEPCVVAVGGGLMTVEPVRKLLRARGFVVGLDASLSVLLSRLAQSEEIRPLLLPDPAQTLPGLLSRRESAYRDVDVRICVDDLSAEQAAECVSLLYRQRHPTLGMGEVIYSESLPDPAQLGSHSIVVSDQVLSSVARGALCPWLSRVPLRYEVTAGESLKELSGFASHVEQILALTQRAETPVQVVAIGGGSVGDFAGFFASVWKRGVPLVQIPSTWLAAIDSAHGGKNALNVGKIKNQIGTIVFAKQIYLCKELLFLQPKERAREALGELLKIAIIDGGEWTKELFSSALSGSDLLWRFLPDAVAAKYKVVRADPYEKLGVRHHLNLGHTLGHVLESVHQLPHGLAVAQGLHFALAVSRKLGFLAETDLHYLQTMLRDRFGLADRRRELAKIPQRRFVELLGQDKKRTPDAAIRFVVVAQVGQVQTVALGLPALCELAIEQGYVLAE